MHTARLPSPQEIPNPGNKDLHRCRQGDATASLNPSLDSRDCVRLDAGWSLGVRSDLAAGLQTAAERYLPNTAPSHRKPGSVTIKNDAPWQRDAKWCWSAVKENRPRITLSTRSRSKRLTGAHSDTTRKGQTVQGEYPAICHMLGLARRAYNIIESDRIATTLLFWNCQGH